MVYVGWLARVRGACGHNSYCYNGGGDDGVDWCGVDWCGVYWCRVDWCDVDWCGVDGCVVDS